jgi:hypothetical protein
MFKRIELLFVGFQRGDNVRAIPPISGIYVVTSGRSQVPGGAPLCSRILYIGEAENLWQRVTTHDLWSEWSRNVSTGEALYFYYAALGGEDLHRVEAALIFHHKPLLNTDYKWAFPFDETEVISSSMCILISPLVHVYRTEIG